MNAGALDLRGIVRVYWSLLLGNIVEWYEFAVFGYLEPYLEHKFFQGSAVAAWLGFGVTFLARPLGGVVFGTIGDQFGRSAAVNLSLIGMLVGTAGQGCLPTYDSGSDAWGLVGLIILIIFRLLQGLSAAGEISTISIYLTEVGERATLGRNMSLIAITINIGFLSAKAVVFLFSCAFGEEALADWGWRVPFLLSLVPGIIAIIGRRWIPESGAFLAEKDKQTAHAGAPQAAALEAAAASQETGPPVSDKHGRLTGLRMVLAEHYVNIAIGMGGVAASAILQYGGFVWVNAYLQKHKMPSDGTMWTNLTARGWMLVLAFPVGWLTDRYGVAWVHFVGGILLAVFSVPLFAMVAADPSNVPSVVMLVGIAFGTLGCLTLTTFFYFVVELFPTAVRGAAVGLSYNLGFGLFGGLAPFAMQASLSVSPIGPGIVLALGGVLTSMTIWGALVLRRRGTANLTHIRAYPYFASGTCCAIGDEQVKLHMKAGCKVDGEDGHPQITIIDPEGREVREQPERVGHGKLPAAPPPPPSVHVVGEPRWGAVAVPSPSRGVVDKSPTSDFDAVSPTTEPTTASRTHSEQTQGGDMRSPSEASRAGPPKLSSPQFRSSCGPIEFVTGCLFAGEVCGGSKSWVKYAVDQERQFEQEDH